MELKSKHKKIQSNVFFKGRLPINLDFKMNNMELILRRMPLKLCMTF